MRCRADERVEDSHYSQEYSLALIQKLVQRNFIIFSRDGGVEGLNLPRQSILHSHLGCIYHSFFPERECIEFIYCQYYPAIWDVVSNTPPPWKKEWQYTASSRN